MDTPEVNQDNAPQEPVTFLDAATRQVAQVADTDTPLDKALDINEAYPGDLNAGISEVIDSLQADVKHWLNEIETMAGHAHVEVRDTCRHAVAKLRELLGV